METIVTEKPVELKDDSLFDISTSTPATGKASSKEAGKAFNAAKITDFWAKKDWLEHNACPELFKNHKIDR